ncbi:MAG: hypothetical protein ACJ8M1_12065 [Chthoniobacterales bacterium]
MSWAAVSVGELDGGAGVGCSLGFGAAIARGVADAAASSPFDIDGDGLGVLAGSVSAGFLAGDLPFPGLLPDPLFFFFWFDPGDGVLDGLGVGLEAGFARTLSSASLTDDFLFFVGEVLGFGAGEFWSSRESSFDGVFFGAGVGLLLFFFFFGETVGAADGETW